MKVSIIIPGYRTEYIEETLQSVARQTVPAHEVLYVQSKELNAAEKINKLVADVTGDAFIVLSDDDILDPTYIEKTAKLMDQGYDIVYTDTEKFGVAQGVVRSADYTQEAFRISNVVGMTCLVRKSMFEKVGGWDPAQDFQDYDFYYRCFKAGAVGVCIHEPLFKYRIHAAAGSFNMDQDLARKKMKDKHPEIRSVRLKRFKGKVIRWWVVWKETLSLKG